MLYKLNCEIKEIDALDARMVAMNSIEENMSDSLKTVLERIKNVCEKGELSLYVNDIELKDRDIRYLKHKKFDVEHEINTVVLNGVIHSKNTYWINW